MQWRVRRHKRVKVCDHLISPEESSRPIRANRKAYYLVSVVDTVAARGYGRKGAGERADVPHTRGSCPQEGVNGAIFVLRCPDHFAPQVDAVCRIGVRVVRISAGAMV